jgi:uncharacterized membrane protein
MSTVKNVVRVLFAGFLVVAGITHFTNAAFFESIVPPYLPWPSGLVVVSGIAEIALGIALLVPPVSTLAAWGAIALLIAVFPANIHMAVHPELFPDTPRSALLLRLPVQGVFLLIAYWFTRTRRAAMM